MTRGTILQLFEQRVAAHADSLAFAVHGQAKQWSWQQWHHDARRFAAALIDSGCTPGEVVAILAGNTPVWPIADIGALMAGAISVGIYPSSAPVQVHEILNDCSARVVVVDSAEQLAKVLSVRAALPNLRQVIAVGGASNEATDWEAWLGVGAEALHRVGREVDNRVADASPDDVAILIYTSGSTGVPKGARIAHRYITASADSIRETLGLTSQDSALSFLPFCHASERIFGLYTRVAAGMSAMLVERTADLWDAARSFEPTLFGGLPRFYEKIYEALLATHATLSGAERATWDRAIECGRLRVQLLRDGLPLPRDIDNAWLQSARLPSDTIAKLIGTRVRLATSGGAMLPAQIADYLAAAGLTVLGAYGLTEHLCTVMHRPTSFRFDSAGLPMPGTTLRISDQREIQIRRSELTFSGYHNKPLESRDAFTADGKWLCTGDLGFIDGDGRLHVTGREKDLIALSGGKKVAPVPIERRLLESPWISQAVLFGENRKYICALIALRRDYVEEWARQRGIAAPYEALIAHPDVVQQVQRSVDEVNQQLSRPEQIKRFALLGAELSAEREELTPTLKLRRAVIEQKHQTTLERLYQQTAAGHEQSEVVA